jgi:hypothetical protein
LSIAIGADSPLPMVGYTVPYTAPRKRAESLFFYLFFLAFFSRVLNSSSSTQIKIRFLTLLFFSSFSIGPLFGLLQQLVGCGCLPT